MLAVGIGGHRTPVEIAVVAAKFQHYIVALRYFCAVHEQAFHAVDDGAAEARHIVDGKSKFAFAARHKRIVAQFIFHHALAKQLLVGYHTFHDGVAESQNFCHFFVLFYRENSLLSSAKIDIPHAPSKEK